MTKWKCWDVILNSLRSGRGQRRRIGHDDHIDWRVLREQSPDAGA